MGWQAVAREGADAMSVRLGTRAEAAQAQLDGFKSRVLRAEAPAQRHLYATAWRALDSLAETAGVPRLVVSGEALTADCACQDPNVTARLMGDEAASIVAAAAQRASRVSLSALEMALGLAQAQAAIASAASAWLVTTGATLSEGAGSWGLARSARMEALVAMRCIDASSVPSALAPPLRKGNTT